MFYTLSGWSCVSGKPLGHGVFSVARTCAVLRCLIAPKALSLYVIVSSQVQPTGRPLHQPMEEVARTARPLCWGWKGKNKKARVREMKEMLWPAVLSALKS